MWLCCSGFPGLLSRSSARLLLVLPGPCALCGFYALFSCACPLPLGLRASRRLIIPRLSACLVRHSALVLVLIAGVVPALAVAAPFKILGASS